MWKRNELKHEEAPRIPLTERCYNGEFGVTRLREVRLDVSLNDSRRRRQRMTDDAYVPGGEYGLFFCSHSREVVLSV